MDKKELVIYLFVNIFYMFIIYSFFDVYLEKKKISKKAFILVYILYYLFISIVYLKVGNAVLTLSTNIIVTIIICNLYDTGWKEKLFSTVIVHTIGMICELILLFEIDKYNFIENDIRFIWEVVCSKLLLFMILKILEHYRKKRKTDYIKNEYWSYIFLVPIFSIFILHTLFLYYSIEKRLFCINIIILSIVGVLAINLVTFYLNNKIIERCQINSENTILQNKIKYYTYQYSEIDKYQKKVRSLSHDMKNHLISIRLLAEKEGNEEIKKYVNDLLKYNNISDSVLDTGNTVIDAIIGYKISYADSLGIKVNVDVQIAQNLDINETCICAILGNALDNAIEACSHQRQGEKKINIIVSYLMATLFICISNTYDHNLNIDNNNNIITNKKDKINHGIGLNNIKQAVEKYEGQFIINYINNLFQINVLLYNIKIK